MHATDSKPFTFVGHYDRAILAIVAAAADLYASPVPVRPVVQAP